MARSKGSVSALVPIERVEQAILLIRGEKVILDADLAMLYGVTTKALNQAVKRNAARFPEDFMFQLTVEEKQEVVGPFENVDETHLYEPQRSLMPSRVDPNHARITHKFERAYGAIRKHESQYRDYPQAQTLKSRMNRKIRSVRLDPVIQQHVEHRLVPIKLCLIGQARPRDVSQSFFIRCEGLVRFQRYPGIDH